MTNEELRAERTRLIREASMFQTKPERIPHISFFVTWKILDYGCKLSEAMNDYDLMEKVCRQHQELYNFDAIFELGGRNAVRIPEALGGNTYQVNDEAGTVNYVDTPICSIDELEELAADPTKFFWEKGMARKYPCWADKTVTVDRIQNVLTEQGKFFQYYMKILQIMKNEYSMPTFTAQTNGFTYCGLDFLFNSILGIKNLSIAMRKKPEQVEAAIAALNKTMFDPGLNTLLNAQEGPDMTTCFDYDITMLVHTILNRKQFERFLWPDMGRVVNALIEKKKTVRMFMEGSSRIAWDYFQDAPKGIITMHPEQDDVFEVRKALPNCAINGGMPVTLMGSGTPQECVDRVKLCCDELGRDGGFLLCQDKMVSFRNDATRENVLAISEFIQNYRA